MISNMMLPSISSIFVSAAMTLSYVSTVVAEEVTETDITAPLKDQIHDEESHDDDGNDNGVLLNTSWTTTFYEKISGVASIWLSRVVVAITVIVFYDIFSPERRQRRRREMEERRLRQEDEEQQKMKKQVENEKGVDDYSSKRDSDPNKPIKRSSYKPSEELNFQSLSETRETQQKIEVDLSVQNRFLDRLEKEQKNSVREEREAEEAKKDNIKELSTDNLKPKRQTPLAPQQLSQPPPPPRIKASNNAHPGMNEFAYWYDVETSLFRIYTLTRKDGQEVVPPYVPNSRRGNVSIFLNVTNSTNHTINVFWVDYTGKHVLKGTIRPNHNWEQTTYIDHPWVFENAYDKEPYLYYVPYRAIPTLPAAKTLSPDGETGMHKFTLVPSKPNDDFIIGVQDEIMPHPGFVHFHQPLLGITWTLTHMSRMMSTDDIRVDTLQKYLKNVMDDPAPVKYRQIRIASKNFAPIWQSPMRGLLLAIGFVEVGAYAELGCHDVPLSRDRVQEVALLSYLLTQWRFKPTADAQAQPDGALDGYGRAGFGRAGSSN